MMQITITLNGTKISPEIEPDTLLIDLVRSQTASKTIPGRLYRS